MKEPPIGSLAVRSFFFASLRKHPEHDGRLPESAARLVLGIDQYERHLGGGGVFYSPEGSEETDTHFKVKLVLNAGGWEAFERMDKIHTLLSELAAKTRQPEVVAQDADLRDRVAALLDSPIPRAVAERLD